MGTVLPDSINRVLRAVGPEATSVQREMVDYADEAGFPIIGPEAGGLLRLLARMLGAESVFEFGSGFGYSATWFARGMPADGHVVLTEEDPDELALAREYLDRADIEAELTFEQGDAVEIVRSYDGPFDLVLLDISKSQYPAALDAVTDRIVPGSVVVADNVLRGPHEPPDIADALDGDLDAADASLTGMVRYLERVGAGSAFESTVVPVGNGVAVSRYAG